MLINYCKIALTVFCGISICLHYVFGSPTISNDYISEEDVINYITKIESNIEITADPCNNFSKYACGRMVSEKPVSLWHIESLVEKFFIDGTPTTKYEEIVREFYSDCKKFTKNENNILRTKAIFEQIELLKPFESFPVKKDAKITTKDIAELEALLNTLGEFVLINIHPNKLGQIHIAFGSRFRTIDLKNLTDFVHDNLYNILPEQINEDEITKIFEFLIKSRNKTSENNGNYMENLIEFESFENIRSKIQLKNFDWINYEKILTKAFYSDQNLYKFIFKMKNENALKDFINLYDSTNINTIANAQLFVLLNFFKTLNCNIISEINRMPVLNKIWKDNLNADVTTKRYEKFLNNFEVDFKNTISKLHNLPLAEGEEYLQMLISNTRNILANHSTLITEEKLDNYYKDYKNGKFYENTVIYFQKLISETLNAVITNTTSGSGFLGMYTVSIELDIKNKPYLYYYNEISFKLWYQFFRITETLNNTSAITKCLNQYNSSDISDFDTKVFLTTYASMKSVMPIYFTNEFIIDEIKLSEKNKIKLDQLFFTALAQSFCRNAHHVDIETDPLFSALTNLKEFNEAFSCPDENSTANLYNNKNCKIETCENDFKTFQHLLPYALTECSNKN